MNINVYKMSPLITYSQIYHKKKKVQYYFPVKTNVPPLPSHHLAGPAESRPTPVPSRGSGWSSDRAVEPGACHQNTIHSGSYPHCGETAEGEEEHALCPQPTSRHPLHREPTTARPDQGPRLCYCKRHMWRRGNISSCSQWEDLPAHSLWRWERWVSSACFHEF